MSFNLMAQVWEAEMRNINNKFVLLALADYADEENQCFPSAQTIAEKCCLSKRTVQRVIAKLEEDGYITKMQRTRKDGSLSSNHYVVSEGRIGSVPQSGGSVPQSLASLNLPINLPKEPIKDTKKILPFDLFWSDYPKKSGKGAARAAFSKAIKKATVDEIMSGLLKHEIQTMKDVQFIPHPATWLNQERWADEGTQKKEGGGWI